MSRNKKLAAAGCGGLLLLVLGIVVAVVVMLSTGSAPMQDGGTLADGKVETVVDGVVSIHLLDAGESKVVLVDAGFDPKAEALLARLETRGLEPDDIAGVLLTHGHGDHIAGLSALPNARTYVLEPDADLVRGLRAADNAMGRGKDPEPTGFTIHTALQDGDKLKIGALEVEVFAIPGHTHGSAAFLAHGVLFMGDSAASTSEGEIVAAPPVFSADRPQNQRSLRALCRRLEPRREDVAALAFGHQGPLQGLDPLLRWCRDNPEP